jgi:aryl-alcohol dehydrogenase-like predicted oxidoreductase
MDRFRRGGPLHWCQPPYNLFERQIEGAEGGEMGVMPYCKVHGIALMTYGALCRGLLSGRMKPGQTFTGDDLRKADPKFQEPRFGQYLKGADLLREYASSRFSKDLLPFAVRWALDKGADTALWGARRPDQVAPLGEVLGWHVDEEAMRRVDAILDQAIIDPVGPEFMAPPARPASAPASG